MNATIARYTTSSVTSKDGTTIGYLQLGHGPGVVLLHGAMESAASHIALAELLADTFTVYLPDRRGRGMSGPYPEHYSVRSDIEDMDALLIRTGAHFVFGVSSGAIIWLQAALALPTIQRAALFEPPLLAGGAASSALLRRYDDEIAQGKVAAALVTGMKAARLGPPIFNLIPRSVLERLTQTMLGSADKKASNGDVTMRMLAPTLHYDFELVRESEKALGTFRSIRAEVLLLGGGNSPSFLKAGLDALERVLPSAKRIEFPGLAHSASGNPDDPMTGRGADPERVAVELRRFFA
jgi:pimeloyl-ACP methyl ester carboxylesterase